LSLGFTEALTPKGDGVDGVAMLNELMRETGQSDASFANPNIKLLNIAKGDIIIWDNRRYVHHAKHSDVVEPTKTFRLTAYDGLPFDAAETSAEVRREEDLSHA
jgi:alpha-ketoglutarate-dependent taurine dioxygenase